MLQSIIEDQYFHKYLEKQVMYLTKLEEERSEIVDKIMDLILKVHLDFLSHFGINI